MSHGGGGAIGQKVVRFLAAPFSSLHAYVSQKVQNPTLPFDMFIGI